MEIEEPIIQHRRQAQITTVTYVYEPPVQIQHHGGRFELNIRNDREMYLIMSNDHPSQAYIGVASNGLNQRFQNRITSLNHLGIPLNAVNRIFIYPIRIFVQEQENDNRREMFINRNGVADTDSQWGEINFEHLLIRIMSVNRLSLRNIDLVDDQFILDTDVWPCPGNNDRFNYQHVINGRLVNQLHQALNVNDLGRLNGQLELNGRL